MRKAGWDTHGLPVEIEVEKSLGISGKNQIENIVKGDKKASIEKFNKRCRESVWKYKNEWEQFSKRMGFWVDLNNPYVTYENYYVESVWAILKKIWDRKSGSTPMIYKGHKVVPYCPRCGTAVSSHEVAQGYEKVKEISVFVRFLVTNKQLEIKDKKNGPKVIKFNKPTYFLSWTTTPWTLPGNVALAVGEGIEYAIVSTGSENYIIASSLLEKVISEKNRVLEKVQGRVLVGLKYEPLFKVKEIHSEKSYQVYPANFVNTEEGTGVVHTAVMYGEDDYNLGTAVGLPKSHTVNEEGKFVDSLNGLSGMYVKDGKTEKQIIATLKRKKFFYKTEEYEHDYPFCWRCKTALIYYARDSWFIRMSSLRQELQKNNEQINWVPDYIKHGRFGEWLKEAKDWAISRERYWGTPLPFWRCQSCDKVVCVGSIEDLKSKAVNFQFPTSGNQTNSKLKTPNFKFDLHRPYIDEVKIKCDGCGREMERVSEVLDVWFDSGSMPYAQWHYPIKNEDSFKNQFPADYICEAIDQTRGWFYTLLAIATAMDYKIPPYKNVINLGHLLDKDGKKMSKSKGNIVDPKMLADKYGMDIVRWFMYTVNQPGDSKNFSEDDLTKMQRRVQIILWNVYNYFLTYASAAKWEPGKDVFDQVENSPNILDRWVNVKLQSLVNGVTRNLNQYNLFRAVRDIEEYIQDLSTWYLRRSRGRGDQEFFATLFYNLVTLIKLMAPFTPFMSEYLFQNLRQQNFSESVHLEEWPEKKSLSESDKKILSNMKLVRAIVEAVLSWRKKSGIKVRQPLSDLLVKSDNEELRNFSFLLSEELNFVNIQVSKELPEAGSRFEKIDAQEGKHPQILINKEITPELRRQGMARDIEREVQHFRKTSGLQVGQMVDFYYDTKNRDIYDAFEHFDQEKTYVSRVIGARQKADFETEIKVSGQKIWIGLKKSSKQ